MRVGLDRDRHRVAATACAMACLVGFLAGCVDGPSRSESIRRGSAPSDAAGTTVRVLQMNLCNSGRAECYTGGDAVRMAVALVHQWRPGMLSLNEVCRGDVGVLKQAMSGTSPATKVVSAFMSARNDLSGAPVRCRNGQQFGDGVVVVERSSPVHARTSSGVYPMQDPGDVEHRSWVCVNVVGEFSACTTHTASTSTSVALAQCRYLLRSVVLGLDRQYGSDPVIVGADLNLAARGTPSAGACLPSGYQRADDGGVQDVLVGPTVRVQSRRVIDMRGTTDHPGLLVEVLLSRR